MVIQSIDVFKSYYCSILFAYIEIQTKWCQLFRWKLFSLYGVMLQYKWIWCVFGIDILLYLKFLNLKLHLYLEMSANWIGGPKFLKYEVISITFNVLWCVYENPLWAWMVLQFDWELNLWKFEIYLTNHQISTIIDSI